MEVCDLHILCHYFFILAPLILNVIFYKKIQVRIIDDDLPLAQFAVAFSGASWTDPDSTALMVIQQMLGSWNKYCGGGKHNGLVLLLNTSMHFVLCYYLNRALLEGFHSICVSWISCGLTIILITLLCVSICSINSSELVQRVAINEIAESVMAFNTNYKDTGLFGVYAEAKVSPKYTGVCVLPLKEHLLITLFC